MQNVLPQQSMAIGPLGDPTTVFVRKFRWTFGSPSLPAAFVKKVNFDFVNKIIEMDYLEVYTNDRNGEHLQDWIDGPYQKDTLTFTTFDGCGNPLYKQDFFGLFVASDILSFDYDSIEVSVRKIAIKYEKSIRNRVFPFPGENTTPHDPKEATLNYLNSQIVLKL